MQGRCLLSADGAFTPALDAYCTPAPARLQRSGGGPKVRLPRVDRSAPEGLLTRRAAVSAVPQLSPVPVRLASRLTASRPLAMFSTVAAARDALPDPDDAKRD